MSTAVDCKRSLEIEIPLEEVEKTRERVTNSLKQKVRLPGFRPGKAPVNLIRSRFESEIRSEVLEVLLPAAFRKTVDGQGLKVVGTPDVSELKFEAGQPIRFKADFEVAPDFEVESYRGITVKYEDPTVTEEELDKRIEALRENKAEFVNLDPRPIENGDYVQVQLKSLSGLADAVDQEAQIQVGGAETVPGFNEALVGANVGDVKQVDITYPEDFNQDKLAGKTVSFEITAKTLRKKELPALDDEFAKDLGDYQTLDELKDAVRKSMLQEKRHAAQQVSKEELVDKLVEGNAFPVPEAYIDRQIENQVRMQLRELAGQGVDPDTIKLDWAKVKEAQREKALRNVRASLLLEKIAQKESITASKEEVDAEVQRAAQQSREPLPVTRARLEKDGVIERIANHIQTEKTLQFLFDQAERQA